MDRGGYLVPKATITFDLQTGTSNQRQAASLALMLAGVFKALGWTTLDPFPPDSIPQRLPPSSDVRASANHPVVNHHS
jgi:hypothetical protein